MQYDSRRGSEDTLVVVLATQNWSALTKKIGNVDAIVGMHWLVSRQLGLKAKFLIITAGEQYVSGWKRRR